MQNLNTQILNITVQADESPVKMVWTGESNDRNPSLALNPYFDSLLNQLKGRKLVISFAHLKYMNSSTVAPIIRFIKNLDAAGVETLITYDKRSKWQAASFKALATLSKLMTQISVKGK